MSDLRKGGEDPAGPGNLFFGNLPDRHGIAPVSRFLMAQDGAEAADHSPPQEEPDSPQKVFFFPASLASDLRKRGGAERNISLNLANQSLIFKSKLYRIHGNQK